MQKRTHPWFQSLEKCAVPKTVDPLLAEIMRAIARGPEPVPCVKCGSLDCGPVRCRFQDPVRIRGVSYRDEDDAYDALVQREVDGE